MKTFAVLSALGTDRVGVADDLAAALAKRKIEIETSRMSALGGEFAMVLRVAGSSRSIDALREDLSSLGESLRCHLEMKAWEDTTPLLERPRFVVETYSVGASGVGAVTSVLKRHDVNIDDLEIDSIPGAWTAEMLFRTRTRISVPSGCSLADLRGDLRKLEQEHDFDIVLRPACHPDGE